MAETTGLTAEFGDILKENFGIYAEYIILHRAIPDIRDGLKPVQRRLIYGAWEMGARVPNKLTKCAKVVGNVMGAFHPHGDSSIYDALVKLIQPFNMNYPLFQGQGNFGSLEDNAAAPRYTECRLNKMAQEMFCANLNHEVVNFLPTYDESTTEPEVLPTELPHILINPNSGIAVGVATDILPCCPHEVIDLLIKEIDKGLITESDKSAPKIFKGPDLPTGGIIEYDKKQLNSLWLTGNSKWNLRGEMIFEINERSGKSRVVVTSLPFQQRKDQWLTKTAKMAEQKNAEGRRYFDISDMRDESNKDGFRVVFDPGRSTSNDIIQNMLYKNTQLQQTANTNMVAIVDGHVKYVGVRECLLYWLDFRRECVRKILEKEKREKEERIEIIDGFIIVHANIEDVVKTIRKSEDAKAALVKKFKFTERQVNAVIAMRLGSLRKIDENELKTERGTLQTRVNEIIAILKDPKKIDNVIKERLTWWKDKFEPRRTKVVREFGEISTLDTVIEQDVMVTINNKDEVKLTDVGAYRRTKRGAAGVKETKSDDDPDAVPRLVAQVSTHDTLYTFTDQSKVFEKSCHELPITKRRGKAFQLTELFPLEEDERVVYILAMDPMNMADDDSVILLRSNGNVKRLACKGLLKKRGKLNGEVCCRTDLDDSILVAATLAPKDRDLIFFTKKGQYRRITVDTLRMNPSRKSGANKCCILVGSDEVIGLDSIGKNDNVVTVSEYGFGTKFNESKLPWKKGRSGKGQKLAGTNEKIGNIVYGGVVKEEDELFLTTSGGRSIKIAVKGLRPMSTRGSKGVRLQKLKKNEKIVAVTKIEADQD